MRKTMWMRLGLAAVLLNGGLASVLAAGCTSDDNSTPGDAGADRSVTDGPVAADSGSDVRGSADAGADATISTTMDGEAGVAPVAKVYLVHASPDAPPLRFCFGLPTNDAGGVTILSIAAAPDTSNPAFPYPGLFPGFGGPLDTHGLDPSAATFNVYAIRAGAIANQSADGGPDGGPETKCTELLGATGSGGLLSPSDYFYAGTFQMGMFAHGTSWLVALTGCVAGESAAAALCPAPYAADAGNLQLLPWQLDRTTTVSGTQIGAQFVQASSAWDNASVAEGGLVTTAGFFVPTDASSDAPGASADASDALAASDAAEAGDASASPDGDDGSAEAATDASDASAAVEAAAPASALTFVAVAADAKFGELKPISLKAISGVTYDGTSLFGAQSLTAGGANTSIRTAWPLVPTASQPLSVQSLTWGATPPAGAALANGSGFVFVLVGNPGTSPIIDPVDGGPSSADAGGVFNAHYPHILAFPTK